MVEFGTVNFPTNLGSVAAAGLAAENGGFGSEAV
jgi:hypothetical protein